MIRHLKGPAQSAAPTAATGAVGGADDHVANVVTEIIDAVAERGDEAVRHYSRTLDNWQPEHFRLSDDAIAAVIAQVPAQTRSDIAYAQTRVRAFAEAQLASMSEIEVTALPGVILGHRHLPVATVGAYVPGGRYPLLASAHMTILTAKVAGVPRVIACTPPDQGRLPAATIAAMHLAGADEIHILGGVQAIAALALGTASIAPVDLIVGPGNAYVAEAKRRLYGRVGIDLIAGPSEILIVADETADSFTVAVDLLSQAEHGPDSPAVLITTSPELAVAVLREVAALLPTMPTRANAEPAWRDHGEVIVVDDIEQAYWLANERACEHVQILTANPREALDRMTAYGALFLGRHTSVPYGDKVIGTNHVLPTRRAARYTGGLWVGRFLRTVTYQEVTDPQASAALGEVCARLSRVESFEGHARSGDLRHVGFDRSALAWAPAPPDPGS
ncbi:MAG: histidinol dehydrogenase [Actinomycetales bacterium]|nr:histidinol dehydrogenase [Actinomycetales bacterium]